MPLNKLENFIKNYEGRILYVNSNDLDATDSISNAGNSLTKPFKTIQRALIEAARFSFVTGNDNDRNDRTTILVFPGEHLIDNRPGYGIRKTGTASAEVETPSGQIIAPASDAFNLSLESNFDLTQEDNILYKFNSIHGGVILPRGTSLVGLDLRKTKIRPKYVPNPTDSDVPSSAIFRVTGNCYFWQFSIFDANENDLVYTNNKIFTAGSGNLSLPTFSHHKLTCFEYCDGVNVPVGYDITDLDMYYAKLSQAFNPSSGKQIPASQKFPLAPKAFAKERPEWEIVGAFGTDPVNIESIISGDGATPGPIVTVKTTEDHGFTAGTPIKIRGINVNDYNVSTVVQSVDDTKTFTYLLSFVRADLDASPGGSGTATIETDTVKGASPYIFNTSLRSVWGMNGMKADGSKASGFKSMVVAQFTAVSLQKDDRAFVKYDPITRVYNGIDIQKTTGSLLSSESASKVTSQVYHLDQDAIYRPGWEPSHIKIVNDAFIQVVSVFAIGFNKHFDAQSGGDGSITNSNSNFGQISLVAEGFKKEAFNKDDQGYITSIITPRFIPPSEQNVDWISIDVGLTISANKANHLYLFGFNTLDNVPPNLIQGYRVGAKQNDILYLNLPDGSTRSARVLMTDNVVSAASTTALGANSSFKEYAVGFLPAAPNYDTLTLTTGHALQTGEKILIISDVGDLPENLTEHKIYYAIRVSSTEIKVASSITNAQNGLAIRMYGGRQLRVLSRVSDIDSGELGSPIQWDPNRNNWFIHVSSGNTIFTALQTLGTAGFDEPRTDVTYFKRIEDSRSLDEKIYKVRVVIPKESVNAKDPGEGFIVQESSTTGPVNNAELNLPNITAQNYNYKRNPRFISTCSLSGVSPNQIVTIETEIPHNLTTGDRVFIKNVKSSTNVAGINNVGYNGDFTVTVVDSKRFTYPIKDNDGVTHNVGIFSGASSRDVNLPRFERNDWKSNFYIYRKEVLSPYVYNVQDGIYHLYLLKSDNAIPDTFTDYKYSQSIVNFYPQKDPDNIDDNPNAAASFAKRSPLGEVITNDLKKSVTRETVDTLVKKLGVAPIIQSVSPIRNGISTITTTLNHGLNGIVNYSNYVSGTGYSIGTHFNVKLVSNDDDNAWNGATANVVVSGVANSITSLQIVDGGSGYNSTTLKISGFPGATVTIPAEGISNAVNNSVQITGVGTNTDGLFRIVSVPSRNQIAIACTENTISPGQYVFNISPSVVVSSVQFNANSGISTIVCDSAHGLVAGNKFRVVDSNNNNIGDYIVNDIVGISTIIVRNATSSISSANRILKHGFAANDLVSDSGSENLGSRGVPFYANESAILLEDLGTDSASGASTFSIRVSNSGIGTVARFPLGSYIQINNEIMRISSSTLSGSGNDKITVLRGVLGTQKETHLTNSLIKKIKPIAVEFRRPSILRASGHTFEYLGFGPGNYSTGLPQIQARSLTERADFLSQSQEKSCGSVAYTGMNSDGDFFIGNTKYSSDSGEQTTFDIPIPTVTGQDPSRLSAVFDEIIVKERILVEGGKSKKILSQFDGPVTFNENIIINNEQTKINSKLLSFGNETLLRLNSTEQSNSTTTGSFATKGGVGIAKNLNVGGSVSILGITTFNGEVSFNSGLVPDAFEDAYIGSPTKPWASAWIGGIGIATAGVPGGTEVEDRTINAWTGDLVLTSQAGIVSVTDNLEVTNDLLVKENSRFVGVVTFQANIRYEDNVKALFGNDGDLEIFHDGSNSFIRDVGTGDLNIDSTNGTVRLRTNSTENSVVALQNSGVELYFDNARKLQTTNEGLNVTGIVTASNGFFPLTDSGAPLGSLDLSFSEVFVDNLRLDGNTLFSTNTNGNITLSANGTGVIETVNDVNFGNAGDLSTLTVVGQVNADNLRLDGNSITSTNTNGNIELDANGTGIVDINSPIDVEGTSIFQGEVTINTGIVPDNSKDAYIGRTGREFAEAWIGDLRLAVGTGGDTDNTITTASGNLFLGTNGNTTRTTINGILDVLENTFVSLTRVKQDQGVIPDVDLRAFLGSSTNRFSEAYIGNLRLAVGTGGDTDNTITTGAGNLFLDSDGGTITLNDPTLLLSTLQVNNTSSFRNNVFLEGSDLQIELRDAVGGTSRLRFNTNGNISVGPSATSVFNVTGSNGNTTSSGILAITNGADSSSSTDANASIRTAGGAAIAKNLYVGGTLGLSGNITAVNGTFSGTVTANQFNGRLQHSISTSGVITGGSFNNTGNITIGINASSNDTSGDSVVQRSGGSFSANQITANQFNGKLQYSVSGSGLISGSFNNTGNATFTVNGSSSNTPNYVVVRDGSGNFSAGTITATLNGNASTATRATHVTGSAGCVLYNNATNNTTTSTNLRFDGSNLTVAGDVTAFASDIRLKTNIKPISDALQKVSELNGFTYEFNEIGESLGFERTKRHSGVSAQEIQSVLPEAVAPAPADSQYLTVKYEKIVPLLIEAIKELKNEIELLKNK